MRGDPGWWLVRIEAGTRNGRIWVGKWVGTARRKGGAGEPTRPAGSSYREASRRLKDWTPVSGFRTGEACSSGREEGMKAGGVGIAGLGAGGTRAETPPPPRPNKMEPGGVRNPGGHFSPARVQEGEDQPAAHPRGGTPAAANSWPWSITAWNPLLRARGRDSNRPAWRPPQLAGEPGEPLAVWCRRQCRTASKAGGCCCCCAWEFGARACAEPRLCARSAPMCDSHPAARSNRVPSAGDAACFRCFGAQLSRQGCSTPRLLPQAGSWSRSGRAVGRSRTGASERNPHLELRWHS